MDLMTMQNIRFIFNPGILTRSAGITHTNTCLIDGCS